MRVPSFSAALATVAVLVACGGSDPVEPPVASRIDVVVGGDGVWEQASTPLSVAVKDQRGEAMIPAPIVTWTSDDTTIAIVASGRVWGRSPGTTTLTAQAAAARATVGISVQRDAVAGLALAAAEDSVVIGRAVRPRVVVRGAHGGVLEGRTVAWSSETPAVAAISVDGEVQGVAIGEARIVATVEGRSTGFSIRVVPIPVASVELSVSAPAAVLGDSSTLSAVVLADDGTALVERPVTYRSLNPRIVQLEGDVLLALGSGVAEVEARVGGRADTVALTVTRPSHAQWDVDLVFDPRVTADEQEYVRQGLAQWQKVVVGPADLEPDRVTVPAGFCSRAQSEPISDELITTLRVYVNVANFDGTALAKAGPCIIKEEPGGAQRQRPVLGQLYIDTVYTRHHAYGAVLWRNVMVHEFGHIFGIGTLWHHPRFVAAESDANWFLGRRGVGSWRALGGTGDAVPVGTTDTFHWHGARVAGEVMSPGITIDSRLSAITLGALLDIGWRLDFGAADEYAAPQPGASAGASPRRGGGASRPPLQDDALRPTGVLRDGRLYRTAASPPSPPNQ